MNRRLASALVTVVAVLIVAGCSGSGRSGPPPETGPLHLTSTAFADQGLVPVNYSCAGSALSPPMAWHGALPRGTSQWALVVEDVSVTPEPYVHWVVTGIGVDTRTVATGQVPAQGSVQANSGNTRAYMPLCPPAGAVHRYTFSLYALGGTVDTTGDATAVAGRISHAALSTSVLTGTFSR